MQGLSSRHPAITDGADIVVGEPGRAHARKVFGQSAANATRLHECFESWRVGGWAPCLLAVPRKDL